MELSSGSELLRQAVERRSPAAVAFAIGNEYFELPVRFLSVAEGHDGQGLWVEVQDGRRDLLDELVRSRATVELSFNGDGAKVYCDTTVLRVKRWYRLTRSALLRHPDQMSVVDRRGRSREPVPDLFDLTAVARPDAEAAAPPTPVTVFDLSDTGAGLSWPLDSAPGRWKPGQRLRLTLTRGKRTATLTATLRHVQRLSSRTVSAGVEFRPAADSGPDALDLSALLAELRAIRTRKALCTTLDLQPRKAAV